MAPSGGGIVIGNALGGIYPMGSGGNLTPNLSALFTQQSTLTGPAFIEPPSIVATTAQFFITQFIQDATGGRIVSWSSFYTGLSGFAMDTTASTQCCLLWQLTAGGASATLMAVLLNGAPIA